MKASKLLFVLTISVLFTTACKRDNTVILKGDVKGLESQWIYLHNNYPAGSPAIDSTQVLNGKFKFEFHPDTTFQPRLVFLRCGNKSQSISIQNPYNKKELLMDFIMEPGMVSLAGDVSKSKGVELDGGEQNDFYLKNHNLPYIRVSKDSLKKQAFAERVRKLLHQSPDAYWALFAFENLKFEFDKKQLLVFYNEFSNNIKTSYEGRKLKEFIDNQPANANEFLDSNFINLSNTNTPVIDRSKKLNIVVFWASWCGPCRQEIPFLKKIHAQYEAKGVRMVSISIDKVSEDWKKALKEEKMPWQQLIIPPGKLLIATAKYSLNFIPQIYIVDDHNKIVKKANGFEVGNEKTISDFINTYLTKS